eukprot:CAMPEP_0170180556 /NCGR_PEP_ID=MMETSP0040_2-20121228/22284_1 /TAXON_ID=641309 /ORGANISM="Lotharella oceanica, Strain CCMP622" /LENGTH=191 /DNA_ID=CAMNT_0010425237 /DNA_START=329 /DNA_END=904 /DNA_ORIENTATION=-
MPRQEWFRVDQEGENNRNYTTDALHDFSRYCADFLDDLQDERDRKIAGRARDDDLDRQIRVFQGIVVRIPELAGSDHDSQHISRSKQRGRHHHFTVRCLPYFEQMLAFEVGRECIRDNPYRDKENSKDIERGVAGLSFSCSISVREEHDGGDKNKDVQVLSRGERFLVQEHGDHDSWDDLRRFEENSEGVV